MASKFLNISIDNTLGGNSPSDLVAVSQKAIKKYIDDHSGGGGSVSVDGISINRNASNELQTIGVINQNDTTTAINTWAGTKAQYDAIATKDANTLYEIEGYGVFLGTTQIAAGSAELNNPFSLFDFQFSDHILNNASWLRADTFSWQSGEVYVSAYEHLVDDIDGITAETETIGSNTITFYRATDGHKICLADQENIVTAIYADKGVAWYYILDTANTRFKLPRTKFGVTGLRGTVGDYVAAGLPNITGSLRGYSTNSANFAPFSASSGAFTIDSDSGAGRVITASNTVNVGRVRFNASNSSSIYGNSTTVQPRATEMYLYFYVGETIQDATLIDVGEITDTLNGKADVDLSNCTKPHIIETYVNGKSWYRIYSDGWCVQGGYFICTSSRNDQKIDLLKNYSSTDYGVKISTSAENATASTSNATYVALSRYIGLQVNSTKTTSAFYMQVVNGLNYTWEAKGYIN